ncbi:restriction endonuclease subunit S [Alteromonas mediterranea]|uniref:restriction endonuclease subunit S n=1 Tax=Alteromonas mediterranea TaxID=314275 RepID=UPI0003555886|nr:restriction endonuclease subunit S [Alteromonas mediterranea]AGP87572.1 type I restriction-modification system, S subunit [Alteromonas mediterranea U4]AGP91709.1 type I restriction-modification system, S subunit [Alteromonas mediterranea U7]AGP95507.1 type I restriction-modification system, S subunit [Alteromonas mediterranea U8]
MDKTIGLACNISTGKLDANQAVSGGEYPFFTCAEFPDQIDHFAYDDDVVLVAGNNARGNFHVSRYKGKFNAYQRTYILTAKEGFNIDYVYYALKLELKRLREKSQGSQTKFLTMPILTGIHFRDITGDEQTEIANVLSVIDQKIELNNRINAELEAMAKTLYDYWFVQFDFPDDSPQGQGKPYKTSGGKMVYNPTLKREIPEGWSDGIISDVIGKVPQAMKVLAKEFQDNGKVPVIDQSQSYICGFTDDETATIQPESAHVIFGDHTRAVKLVNFDYARGADGTQVLVAKSDKVPSYLLYQIVSDIDLSSYGYARHYKFLKESKCVIPRAEVSQRYQNTVKHWHEKIRDNIFQNYELERLRDWLLPMLMNGQVTVGEAS